MFRLLARPPKIVLVSPQIPPNTGNIARLCAVTGCRLILVEPLGFSIADRDLKRAGLDYWDKVFLSIHPNYDAYTQAYPDAKRFLFSSKAKRSLYDTQFKSTDDNHLIFGSETKGLPKEVMDNNAENLVLVPMLPGSRCLNLSTTAGIAAYEVMRQMGTFYAEAGGEA